MNEEVRPVQKRCRFVIAESDSDSDWHTQPEVAHAESAQLQSESQAASPEQAQQAAQPEFESEVSEYMSCGSGSDCHSESELQS